MGTQQRIRNEFTVSAGVQVKFCSQFRFLVPRARYPLPVPVLVTLVTLRSDNGDVHETVAEKQTSYHFKLLRDYPNSPCYVKEGDFGRS